MQALILAGGVGARLRPYTTVLPKPLMPIGDFPILEIVLRQLKHSGVDSVILAVGYMHQLFETFFQDGEKYGLKISYSFESEPLGTAGPIGLVLNKLEDNFLVMNGDLLTTLNYSNLFSNHVNSSAAATISVHQRSENIDYGVVDYDQNNRLVGYKEKPSYKYNVSMGINVLNKELIKDYIKPNEYLDLPDLMMQLSDSGKLVNCYKEKCDWLDIGRLEDYQKATDFFELNRKLFFID
jgi:NDP-mannose synthase